MSLKKMSILFSVMLVVVVSLVTVADAATAVAHRPGGYTTMDNPAGYGYNKSNNNQSYQDNKATAQITFRHMSTGGSNIFADKTVKVAPGNVNIRDYDKSTYAYKFKYSQPSSLTVQSNKFYVVTLYYEKLK